ncbi:MAG: hypothetical protein LCH84_05095 [Gemmatimonadetes bacterium]|nr:hypothetical protein [Gemmatimonadota bacterium]
MRLKTPLQSPDQREPLGIVISDGAPVNTAPRFSAFVWGPVPDDVDVRPEVKRMAGAHCCA